MNSTSSHQSIQNLVGKLLEGGSLDRDESTAMFSAVVRGDVPDVLLAAALTALKVRGETADELAGAAAALIDSATPFPRPDYLFADVVGTGGDGQNTINLSTIAAITAAACGAKIIKHGNRSISSCSGSFDLLEALGIDFNMSPQQARLCVDEFGICFLFAPNYHPGLKHAATVRKSLGVRTIFNLLGPLVNPSRPPLMLLGVARPELLAPIAGVLASSGCQSAYVVHGSGVDEVAIHGPTTTIEIPDVKRFREYRPEDFGTKPFPLEALTCNNAAESHRRSMAVMQGKGSAAENAAVGVNVALILKLFGHADLPANFQRALQALGAGQPMKLVNSIAEARG